MTVLYRFVPSPKSPAPCYPAWGSAPAPRLACGSRATCPTGQRMDVLKRGEATVFYSGKPGECDILV